MQMVTDGGEKGTDDMMRRRMARSSSFKWATLGRAWKRADDVNEAVDIFVELQWDHAR